jgi:hypothetical protein
LAPVLASAQPDGLEDVALTGAAPARDDEVLVAADEFQSGDLHDQRLVEVGLEWPLEGFERLALGKPALVDAALNAPLQFPGRLGAEDPFEERGGTGPVPDGPGEVVVEVAGGVVQSEGLKVSSESLDDLVGAWGVVLAAGLGRRGSLVPSPGRRSYSSRSRRKLSPGGSSSRRTVSSATYSASRQGAARAARIRSMAPDSKAPKDRACRSAAPRSAVE